ncbi:MAG: hypothetical protein JWM78_2727 [Verrucomicrobiaceae bacterium]|nr:hypothetical protein [Verrucomicrobiaceae bacterium]
MSLAARNAFVFLNELNRDANRLFDTRINPKLRSAGSAANQSAWQPPVDIYEDNEGYYLSVDLPGIQNDSIEVTAHNNVLSIRGTRAAVQTEKELNRSERNFGAFQREFSMPENANLEQIVASSNNGVLEISILKTPKSEPKRIAVQ